MERGDGSSRTSRGLMNLRIRIKAHLTKEAQQPKQAAENNNGKIELDLGLSMNGRFGVDPSSTKNRKRSCSVSNLPGNAAGTQAARAEHSHGEARGAHAHLPRAFSLPANTKGWWGGARRQRKELEAAAARKTRMEKRTVRVVREGKRGVVKNVRSGLHEGEKGGVNVEFPDNDRVNGSVSPMMVQSSDVGSQMGSAGLHAPQAPTMMMGAKPFNPRLRSPSSCRIPNNEHGVPSMHGVPSSSTAVDSDQDDRRLLESAMLKMPHVSTMGKGDDRIDGILYKYTRSGEVKIVCACHGLFLSPAEFIKHGGGGDVEQPLRHIFMNND